MATLEEYIRYAAQQRGIDPDIAVRVAQGEGGLKDPFRHGEGPAPRSQSAEFGPRENSFGPFQLYISGNNAGLGDSALAAGIDPRKDWKGGIDFALDEVTRSGWGKWYGAKAAGITGMMGVGSGAKAIGASPSPYAGMADGPKGQEIYARPVMGSMVAQSSPAPSSSTAQVPAAAQALAGGSGKKMADIFGMMALAPQQQPQFSPVQIMGPSPQQANALSSLIAALKNRTV